MIGMTFQAAKGSFFDRDKVKRSVDAGTRKVFSKFAACGAMEFATMDGDIAAAGSQGLRANCMVTNFSRNEALEEAITVSVKRRQLEP